MFRTETECSMSGLFIPLQNGRLPVKSEAKINWFLGGRTFDQRTRDNRVTSQGLRHTYEVADSQRSDVSYDPGRE